MRRQIYVETDQGIGIGDTVAITSGPYRQIEAKVIEEIPEEDKVQVHIQLRSKDSIVTLPRSFLRLVTRADRPVILDRFTAVKAWFNMFVSEYGGILTWSQAGLDSIRGKAHQAHTLQSWVSSLEKSSSIVRPLYIALSLTPIKRKWEEVVSRFNEWGKRYPLSLIGASAVVGTKSMPKFSKKLVAMSAKHKELIQLGKLQKKVTSLSKAVEKIEKEMTGQRK